MADEMLMRERGSENDRIDKLTGVVAFDANFPGYTRSPIHDVLAKLGHTVQTEFGDENIVIRSSDLARALKVLPPEQMAEAISLIVEASTQGSFISDIAKYKDPYMTDVMHKSILNVRALRSIMDTLKITPDNFKQAGYSGRVDFIYQGMNEIDPELNDEGYALAHSVYPDLFPERELAEMAA